MYSDPSGELAVAVVVAILLFTPVGGIAFQVASSLLGYAGMAIASIWDKDVRADMNAIGWNPFNSDVNKVLNSNKVSFYKGVPVYRTNFNRSGSFCAIFLNRASNTVPDTVRHEWGHAVQQMILGPVKYGLFIGIPSAAEFGKHKWPSTTDYYNRPWETSADIFGGVGGHTTREELRSYAYLVVAYYFTFFSYLFCI